MTDRLILTMVVVAGMLVLAFTPLLLFLGSAGPADGKTICFFISPRSY